MFLDLRIFALANKELFPYLKIKKRKEEKKQTFTLKNIYIIKTYLC